MKVHYERSTVEIAGREFPCVGLICPLHPLEQPTTDADRSLGGPGGGKMLERHFDAWIPFENGIIAFVTKIKDRESIAEIALHVANCEEHHQPDGDKMVWLYLPIPFYFNGIQSWRNAEPEWTVELLHRVSKLSPFSTEGPLALSISLPDLMKLRGMEMPGWLDG
jgi:hypothetical protein